MKTKIKIYINMEIISFLKQIFRMKFHKNNYNPINRKTKVDKKWRNNLISFLKVIKVRHNLPNLVKKLTKNININTINSITKKMTKTNQPISNRIKNNSTKMFSNKLILTKNHLCDPPNDPQVHRFLIKPIHIKISMMII